VRVTVSEVKDSRTTGQFFAGLDVTLALTGDDVAGARGLRVTLTKAVDDSGRNLLPEERRTPTFEVREGSAPPTLRLKLANPARRAATLSEVSGTIEVFLPARDPGATVLAPLAAALGRGKPLVTPALTATRLEVTPLTRAAYEARRAAQSKTDGSPAAALGKALEGMFAGFAQVGENDLVLGVADPGNALVAVDVLDAAGKRIDSQGTMTTAGLRVLKYGRALPPDAQLRILVATPRALATAPLQLRGVALP
jgi:hypothetical protein